MKFKVSIFLTAFALVAFSMVANAQRGTQKSTPAQKADKQTAVLTEKLSLSQDQAEKIKAINLKYAEQHKSLREQSKAEKEKDRSAMKKLHEQQRTEINAVLNKDQQAGFEKLQAERGKNRHDKMGKGNHDGKGKPGHKANPEKRAAHMTDHMTKELSLNQDQAARVKTINQEFATKHQTLRAETEDGQKPDPVAMEKLRKEHAARLKTVLNADQFSQWEKMAKDRKDRKSRHRTEEKGK